MAPSMPRKASLRVTRLGRFKSNVTGVAYPKEDSAEVVRIDEFFSLHSRHVGHDCTRNRVRPGADVSYVNGDSSNGVGSQRRLPRTGL